jgi:hypothetical protein
VLPGTRDPRYQNNPPPKKTSGSSGPLSVSLRGTIAAPGQAAWGIEPRQNALVETLTLSSRWEAKRKGRSLPLSLIARLGFLLPAVDRDFWKCVLRVGL